jgi:hypothetical protein
MTNTPSWFKAVDLSNNPDWFKPVNLPTNQKPEEEGALKSAARYGLQVAKAAPFLIPGVPAANFGLSLMTGGKLNEEEIPEEYQRPPMGYMGEAPQTQQKQPKAPSEQMGNPLGELYKHIEEKTGLPLSAKTPSQKFLSIGADAAAMSPGTPAFRSIIGLTASEIYSKATEIGIPEDAASNLSMMVTQSIARSGLERSFSNKPKSSQKLLENKENPFAQPPNESTNAPPGNDLVPASPQQKVNRSLNIPNQVMGKTIKEALPSTDLPEITENEMQIPEEVEYEKPPAVEAPKFSPYIPPEVDIVGLEPTPHDPKSLNSNIGNVFINRKPVDSTTGGSYLIHTIDDISKPAYERVNRAYDNLDKLIANDEELAPQLAKYAIDEIKKISTIPEKSRTPEQKKLLNFCEDVANLTTGQTEDTELSYRPVQSTMALQLKRNVQNAVDFEFDHDTTGVFKPLIKHLDEQLQNASKGKKESYEALKYANYVYKNQWAKIFSNPRVLKFRSAEKSLNFSSLFKEASRDIDTFRALQRVLREGNTQYGKVMEQILKRAIVQEKMSKYIDNPKLSDSVDFDNDINELRPILSKRELSEVEGNIRYHANEIVARERESKRAKAAVKREIAIGREKHKVSEKEKLVEFNRKKSERAELVKNIVGGERVENKRLQAIAKKEIKEKEEAYRKNVEHWKASNAVIDKIKNMSDEQVARHAMSVDGLHEVGVALKDQPNGDLIFELVKRSAAGKVLHNGKISEPSPEEVLKVLDNVEKRHFLVVTMGKQVVGTLHKVSSKLAKNGELYQKRHELLSKMKVPKSFNYLGRFQKVDTAWKEVVSMIEHPKTYLPKVLGEWLEGRGGIKDVEEHNQGIIDAIDSIDKELLLNS